MNSYHLTSKFPSVDSLTTNVNITSRPSKVNHYLRRVGSFNDYYEYTHPSAEDLTEELLRVKQTMGTLTNENKCLRTKLMRLERKQKSQHLRLDQELQTPSTSRNLVTSLQLKVEHLQFHLAEKDKELSKIKRNVKQTKIEELEIHLTTCYQQIARLRQLMRQRVLSSGMDGDSLLQSKRFGSAHLPPKSPTTTPKRAQTSKSDSIGLRTGPKRSVGSKTQSVELRNQLENSKSEIRRLKITLTTKERTITQLKQDLADKQSQLEQLFRSTRPSEIIKQRSDSTKQTSRTPSPIASSKGSRIDTETPGSSRDSGRNSLSGSGIGKGILQARTTPEFEADEKAMLITTEAPLPDLDAISTASESMEHPANNAERNEAQMSQINGESLETTNNLANSAAASVTKDARLASVLSAHLARSYFLRTFSENT